MVPRSGSTLALSIAESLLGIPHSRVELFNYDHLIRTFGQSKIEDAFKPSSKSYKNQLELMKELIGSVSLTDDQVGLIKTNWIDFDRWSFKDLNNWADSVEFIFVDRVDWIRQAYSLLKAQETGVWHIDDEASSEEILKRSKKATLRKFGFTEMTDVLNELNFQRQGWKRYFKYNSIEPLTLTYEQLDEHPVEVMKNVLNRLGVQFQVNDVKITLHRTSTRSDESRLRNFALLYLKEQLQHIVSEL